jgi:hypothetical protein
LRSGAGHKSVVATKSASRWNEHLYTIVTKGSSHSKQAKNQAALELLREKLPLPCRVFYLCKYRAKVSAYYEDRTDDLCRKLSGVLSQRGWSYQLSHTNTFAEGKDIWHQYMVWKVRAGELVFEACFRSLPVGSTVEVNGVGFCLRVFVNGIVCP